MKYDVQTQHFYIIHPMLHDSVPRNVIRHYLTKL